MSDSESPQPHAHSTSQQIAQFTLVVGDYDEAIEFYTGTLGFILLEDTRLGQTKRWVRVAPPGSSCGLLLAQAATPAQHACIGNQCGGRVFLFLHTDDFQRDYARFIAHGVSFVEEPREEPYGTVAVFTDLYGNKWDLIQPR